jgi:hypothetical protein
MRCRQVKSFESNVFDQPQKASLKIDSNDKTEVGRFRCKVEMLQSILQSKDYNDDDVV